LRDSRQDKKKKKFFHENS